MSDTYITRITKSVKDEQIIFKDNKPIALLMANCDIFLTPDRAKWFYGENWESKALSIKSDIDSNKQFSTTTTALPVMSSGSGLTYYQDYLLRQEKANKEYEQKLDEVSKHIDDANRKDEAEAEKNKVAKRTVLEILIRDVFVEKTLGEYREDSIFTKRREDIIEMLHLEHLVFNKECSDALIVFANKTRNYYLAGFLKGLYGPTDDEAENITDSTKKETKLEADMKDTEDSDEDEDEEKSTNDRYSYRRNIRDEVED